MDEYTTKEQYWIDNLIKGQDIIDASESDSRLEKWVSEGYLDYIDDMIKFGNLRLPTEEYKKEQRLIKVNKKIPKEYLEHGNYLYSIFNGLYIVQEVVFVKAEHCEALLNNRVNDNPKLEEADLLISSFKKIVYESGEMWCIFLVKSGFTERHLGYRSTEWDYPYIYDDECGL